MHCFAPHLAANGFLRFARRSSNATKDKKRIFKKALSGRKKVLGSTREYCFRRFRAIFARGTLLKTIPAPRASEQIFF
jgi:hypothetical protein